MDDPGVNSERCEIRARATDIPESSLLLCGSLTYPHNVFTCLHLDSSRSASLIVEVLAVKISSFILRLSSLILPQGAYQG